MRSAHLLVLACFLIFPVVCHAEDRITGLQISLFHPAQLYSDDYSVDGFRWDIIYGVNKNVQGIDIGIVNYSTGSAQGVELGAANQVDRDFVGVQIGVFYNDVKEEMQGLQAGLINHAGELKGVQIGLLNFNDDTKYLGFFPFINAAF